MTGYFLTSIVVVSICPCKPAHTRAYVHVSNPSNVLVSCVTTGPTASSVGVGGGIGTGRRNGLQHPLCICCKQQRPQGQKTRNENRLLPLLFSSIIEVRSKTSSKVHGHASLQEIMAACVVYATHSFGQVRVSDSFVVAFKRIETSFKYQNFKPSENQMTASRKPQKLEITCSMKLHRQRMYN